MNDLRELYQEVILEHNNHPRNFGEMCQCTQKAHGDNPLCGDSYDIFVDIEGEKIKQVSFVGHGCAISKAAASMMTTKVTGHTIEEATSLIEAFRHMMTADLTDEERQRLGHLRVFEGVSQLPQRVKCAVLPWHTLAAALKGEHVTSTEGEESNENIGN